MKLTKSCPKCGSDEIVRDAWAEWDVDTQTWGLRDFFDNTFCCRCEGTFDSSDIIETPVREASSE